ncbi:MAG: hypothetical protein IJH37_05035 [Clostridia bacterium]|nr:hypothetical protein [Clostridia bacterium]
MLKLKTIEVPVPVPTNYDSQNTYFQALFAFQTSVLEDLDNIVSAINSLSERLDELVASSDAVDDPTDEDDVVISDTPDTPVSESEGE